MVAVDSESVDTSDLRSLADVTSRFGVSVLLGGTVSVDDQQRSVGAFFVFVDQRLLPDAPELAGVVQLDTVRVDDNVRAGGHALRTMSSYLSTGTRQILDLIAAADLLRSRQYGLVGERIDRAEAAAREVEALGRTSPVPRDLLRIVPRADSHLARTTGRRSSDDLDKAESVLGEVDDRGDFSGRRRLGLAEVRVPSSRRGRLCRPIAMARLARNRATILCATRRLRACPTPKQRRPAIWRATSPPAHPPRGRRRIVTMRPIMFVLGCATLKGVKTANCRLKRLPGLRLGSGWIGAQPPATRSAPRSCNQGSGPRWPLVGCSCRVANQRLSVRRRSAPP